MRDFLTPEERSKRMASVRSTDTQLEGQVASLLSEVGLEFRRHVAELPGKPDFLLANGTIALFVDSDFWHGWRYPCWKEKLNAYWRAKIEATRLRDRRVTRRLRGMGILVFRVWEHDLKKNPTAVLERLRRHPTIASSIPRRARGRALPVC